MAWNRVWGGMSRLALAVLVVVLSACGDKDTVVAPDPSMAPLVGDWTATALVVTSVANPDVEVDIIALGAAFSLNIQPSGQYTAILLYAGQSQTEIGKMSVSGNVLTLTTSYPEVTTSTAIFALQGDQLTMDADTEFDFNLDGTSEPALAHFELVR
jgi:hypothetical protein